jgi:membrane protease YdiL (CAAX protease family)
LTRHAGALTGGDQTEETPFRSRRARCAILIAAVAVGDGLKLGLGAWGGIVVFHVTPQLGFYDAARLALDALALCLLPYAVTVTEETGLFPGAIFLRRRPCNEAEFSARWVMKRGVSGAGMILLADLTVVLVTLLVGTHAPSATPGAAETMRRVARVPAAWLILGASGISVGAAMSEEIIFRLVLTVVIMRALAAMPGGLRITGRPSLWVAIFLQAYLFGLCHWAPAGGDVEFAGFIRRHERRAMVDGLILGVIYIRHGLEAATAAHAIYDTALFMAQIAVVKLVARFAH